MIKKRSRFKQTESLEARLQQFATDMRRRADKAPDSEERNTLLEKASNADQAIDLERHLRLNPRRSHAPLWTTSALVSRGLFFGTSRTVGAWTS